MNKLLLYPVAIGLLLILVSCSKQAKSSETISSTKTSVSKSGSQNELERSQVVSENAETTDTSINETYENGSLLNAVAAEDLVKVTAILNDPTYRIDETNSKGETPLLMAVHQNSVDIAKLLIDHGANVNQQDNIKDSPYLFAGAEGRLEILTEILAKSQPDYATYNRFGGNALIPAAEKSHLETVKLLLKTGKEDINHQNNPGYTALIETVALNDGSQVYQDITKELLAYGADKSLKDNSGRTAMDYAQEYGYLELTVLLK